jgi:tRNA(Ile)-lysidine synthase
VAEQGTHKPLVGGSNPPSATNISPHALAASVLDGARRCGIADDSALVLAVSGGADSMALLHGAASLRRWRLTVAHLDHGLRPDSAEDAAFVADAAAALGLPFEVRRTDVGALARDGRLSVEQAGREARYRFLHEIAGEQALIATAHTLDDSAETVLVNLLRGSGLGGAAGIPIRRDRVVRPLLHARRADLRRHLDEARMPYRDDPSNQDPVYLRNRIRAEVMPLLDELRPGAVERIARFSRLAGDDDAMLDRLASAELERRRVEGGEIDWRDPPPRALARRVLRLAVGDPPPNVERIEALLDAAGGDRGGLRIELGGGRVASVSGRRIGVRHAPP